MNEGMEAIGRVQGAEAQAKEIVAKAEANAKRFIEEANAKSAEIMQDAERAAEERRKTMLGDAAARMEKEMAKRQKETDAEAGALAKTKIGMRTLESVAKRAAELILGA
ncbi:MAG: hypothetical protein KGI04_02535 [Candidatus Micrarchaeota archaeon]|nr:hypothetical protein [Candidatus Micrarchaeota archaeon]